MMKILWRNDDSDYDGIQLSEHEAKLLLKLCGKLSLDFLCSKGFTDEEALAIMRWGDAI